MHVHFRNDPTKPDFPLVEENAALLDVYLAHGVVGVREMGGDLSDAVLQWRDEINTGKRSGPRIWTAARKIDREPPIWPGSISASTPEEARQAVRQLKQLGADFVKVYFTRVEAEVHRAVVDEAHKLGLTVTGHLPLNETPRQLGDIGQDGIEHGESLLTAKKQDFDRLTKEFVDRADTPYAMTREEYMTRLQWMKDDAAGSELYGAMAQKKMWLTPTLTVAVRLRKELGTKDLDSDIRKRFLFPAIWESWDMENGRRRPLSARSRELAGLLIEATNKALAAAHKAGVRILAGTDTGVANNYVLPGWSLHEELEFLVKAGLTPLEALRTATLNAALYRGQDATEGSVDKGKKADLLLLRSNPLQSIARTREVEAVIAQGVYYSRPDLDELLRKAQDKAAPAWAKTEDKK
jgi:hypothetical protein